MDTDDQDRLHHQAVLAVHRAYATFSYKPQHGQWTILASFFLTRCTQDRNAELNDEIKLISLATGTKCLPTMRLSPRGEAIHDSHAEVLARRCALRWLLEEIRRVHTNRVESQWIIKRPDGRYALRADVYLNLYVSTVPCTHYMPSEEPTESDFDY